MRRPDSALPPMSTKHMWSLGLVAVMFAGAAAILSAAEPSKAEAALASKLINAIEKSDHDAFVADGEPAFKGLGKEPFAGVAAQLAPKLQNAHELVYLGDLRQKGYHVTLWKISFKDGSDDLLATLSVRGGKVGGFYIR